MRRQLKNFIEQIGKDAVAIIPAAHEVTKSYDTEFKFHQDPDFYYLTGFPEPDAIAVINPSNKKNPFTLFVRPRDPMMETWFGRREGVDGRRALAGQGGGEHALWRELDGGRGACPRGDAELWRFELDSEHALPQVLSATPR